MEEELAVLEKRCEAWKLLANARRKVLLAYRIGKQPSEAAFKEMEKARAVLEGEVDL